MKKGTIGVSLNIGTHVWYERQVWAERQRADQEGWELTVTDAEDDVEQQVDQILELVAGGARALIVSAVRSNGLERALDTCLEAGVPVIGESIALDHPCVVAEVRVDDVAAGRELGEAVGATVEPRGPVPTLLSVGFSALSEAHDRERGFVEGFRKFHPHVVVWYVDGLAQIAAAHDATARFLDHVDGAVPDVLLGVDDESVIGATRALHDKGLVLPDLVSATFGITPPSGLALLDDGTVTYGAAMFAENHGRVLVDLAIDAIEGRSHARLVNPPSAVVSAATSDRAWTRFYRFEGQDHVLDTAALEALDAR